MKYIVIFLIAVSFLAFIACSDRAAELYETAQFEELQNNQKHAVQLYEEILKKYPDGEYAQKARERLNEIRRKEK